MDELPELVEQVMEKRITSSEAHSRGVDAQGDSDSGLHESECRRLPTVLRHRCYQCSTRPTASWAASESQLLRLGGEVGVTLDAHDPMPHGP